MIDHLFRHQYGKMVSILTRIFGLDHLETIEDAVQDTFINALRSWKHQVPEHPEAWLIKAAKNRTLDIFRKLAAEKKRIPKIESGPTAIALSDVFLDHEVEDSVLRMIFTACNPQIRPADQIAFSLKTISGFSTKEIASAFLVKEETIKKRLIRARKLIQEKSLSFSIPSGREMPLRVQRVEEVIYLIFNEGFHSNKKETLIREELCLEAIRLCQLLINNSLTGYASTRALYALMCFHMARLKSKVNENHEVISLKKQDRTQWDFKYVMMGHEAMNDAVETDTFSPYHYEAAIAAEHLKAGTYEATDWNKILTWYRHLEALQPSVFNLLNMAVVCLQLDDHDETFHILTQIDETILEQRTYLYFGLWAEYYFRIGERENCMKAIEEAIGRVSNEAEKRYLKRKRESYLKQLS